MKVTSQQLEQNSFKPIEVTITFETEEQAKAFHNVMDLKPVCAFLRKYDVDPSAIRAAIHNFDWNLDDYDMFGELHRMIKNS